MATGAPAHAPALTSARGPGTTQPVGVTSWLDSLGGPWHGGSPYPWHGEEHVEHHASPSLPKGEELDSPNLAARLSWFDSRGGGRRHGI